MSKEKVQGILFTDLDGTFKRNSLFINILAGLVEQGLLPKLVMTEVERAKRDWQSLQGTFEEYDRLAIDFYEENIVGIPYRYYKTVVRRVVEAQQFNVYRFMKKMIQYKQLQGWKTYLVSASPQPAVEHFAELWGMTGGFGTPQSVDDKTGRISGIGEVVNADAKKIIVERVLHDLDEQRIVVPEANIWACGDTKGDIAMLESVTNPICVNPDDTLSTEAEHRGWRTVSERKDVITETKNGNYMKYAIDVSGKIKVITMKTTFKSVLD